MAALKKKIRIRNGLLNSVMKLFDEKVNVIYNDYSEDKLLSLESLFDTVDLKFKRLLDLNEQISENINDDAELETHFDECDNNENIIRENLRKLEKFIRKHSEDCSEVSISSVNSVTQANVVKLPKIEIRKFYGDPLEWKSFYDSFKSAVDENIRLSKVEKMNYLINLLKADAEAVVKGLPLCNENYDIAIKMLEERFGDPQVLISSHMNKLLSLENIYSINNLKGLRSLCDQVERQVRCLNALGHDPKSYGLMLVPIFMTKLPEELKIFISRKLGKEVWDIQIILDAFKQEIEAREKVQFSIPDNNTNTSNYEMSGTSLHINSKIMPRQNSRECPFCHQVGHKAQNCTVVSKPSARLSILQQQKRCYLCLQVGHNSRNCTAKWKCFSCKGRHHVAICSNNPEKLNDFNNFNKKTEGVHVSETATHVAGSENKVLNPVLLQTAVTNVSSTDEKHSHKVRLLFDSGSQMSYVSPRVRDLLKLETVQTKEMSIKTFGGERRNKVLDLVNICVKTKDPNFNIYIQAFVSDICHPLTNQNIEQAKFSQQFLKDLDLADENLPNIPLDVDILIGADYYWLFMHCKK